MPAVANAFEIVRPLAVMAVVAFLAGFGCYLVFGPPNVAAAVYAPPPAAAQVVSGPASEEWDLPKKI